MKRIATSILIFSCLSLASFAQDLYYLEEGFEIPESQSRWSVDPYIVNITWKYTEGGQYESGEENYNPEIAAQGELNAGLYFGDLSQQHLVKLISPTLELGDAVKPTLRFWHCQYVNATGVDNLRLLFRVGPNSNWELIEEWTSDISSWTDEIFDIEDIDEKYLTDTFQLAFEGSVGRGFGVYVDSVTVKEEAIVEKFVKKTTYNSVEYDVIPSGGTNIPLEEIVIRVLGNSGDAILDSLSIEPTGSGIDYLESNSFQLHYTTSDVYAPYVADTSTVISTAILSAGIATFSDIGYKLRLGDNHLWISASFKNTIEGQTQVRFSIPADGINISDTLYPSTTKLLNRNHTIKESVFYDDFESGGVGWTLEGDFEIGWPEGTTINSQKNPDSPFNGSNILATDLDSGYYKNITPVTAYYAYTPELDLTYYIKAGLYMQSHFSILGSDRGEIDISTDGGSTWQNVWQSSTSTNSSEWIEFYNSSIDDIANRQSQIQLRIGITESTTIPWPGFSIDNFAILGEKLNADVGITEILQPFDGCINCGTDTIQVWVRNYADGLAPDTIPIFFGLWGPDSTLIHDTIFGGINKDDSTLFTFNELANYPKGDIYDKFIVGLNLAGDQDPTNDTLTKPLIIQKYESPIHFEDFEYKGGIWLSSEGSSWLNADMTGTITTDPNSPHIWVLSPSGLYSNNDTSYVVSGCYNLSDTLRNILQFKYWSESESGKDGAHFEYSRNDGNTWKYLNDSLYGEGWNWTVDTVDALGLPGWSGTNSWTTSKVLLPEEIDTAENVKFRLIFMSDASNSYPQGFAFNDLEIYPAPPDVGVSAIISPVDTCQYSNPGTVTVSVKNYGYNKLSTNDTIIVGVDFETDPPVIDTFLLSSDLLPGDSAEFTVNTDIDVQSWGFKTLKAYTLIEDDPWFYNSNNDTLEYTFEVWQNPVLYLLDTISSRQPDTVVLRPLPDPDLFPGYEYLWTPGGTTADTLKVPGAGMYYVNVTDATGNGCSSIDSTLVELLYFDAGMDTLLYPGSSCSLENDEIVKIRIRNHGTDSLWIGDKIALSYQVNGGTIYRDTITLTAPLYRNTTMEHLFTDDPYDFSTPDSYEIITSAKYVGGDFNSSNDNLTDNITVYGYTPLNLGADTTIVGLDHTLDAGPNFEIYAWNTGDSIQSIYIDSSGIYGLQAIDINGCESTDSVSIWFKIRDILPAALVSPISSCDRSGTDMVKIEILNNGTDTISTSEDIDVSYALDGGAPNNVTINLPANLLPQQSYVYEFSGNVDLTEFGTYEFDMSVSTDNDLRPENDDTSKIVYTNANPVVDLNEPEEDFIKQLEYVLDAGTGLNYSYLWQDGSTEQTYTATNTGTYSVTVTDTMTLCYAYDEVILQFDILDYAITGIDLDELVCQNADNTVSIDVMNNGNTPRGSALFTVEIQTDGGSAVREEISYNETWPTNQTKTFTLQNPAVFEEGGEGVLTVTITHEGDLREENDEMSTDVDVENFEAVNFGGDTINPSLPHILDAGDGYSSYKWQDGSTNSTYTATQTGTYWVTVTNNIGCIVTKTVYITDASGINQYGAESMDLRIYPVPASEFVMLEAKLETGEPFYVEIFNTQNQIVFSEQHFSSDMYQRRIDVSDLAEGLYFIRLRNDKLLHLTKIIIN